MLDKEIRIKILNKMVTLRKERNETKKALREFSKTKKDRIKEIDKEIEACYQSEESGMVQPELFHEFE